MGVWRSGLERAVAVEVEQQRAVVDAVDQRGRVRVRVREGIVHELRAERLHGHLRELRRTQRERVRSPVEQLVQLRVVHLALLVALATARTRTCSALHSCTSIHSHMGHLFIQYIQLLLISMGTNLAIRELSRSLAIGMWQEWNTCSRSTSGRNPLLQQIANNFN